LFSFLPFTSLYFGPSMISSQPLLFFIFTILGFLSHHLNFCFYPVLPPHKCALHTYTLSLFNICSSLLHLHSYVISDEWLIFCKENSHPNLCNSFFSIKRNFTQVLLWHCNRFSNISFSSCYVIGLPLDIQMRKKIKNTFHRILKIGRNKRINFHNGKDSIWFVPLLANWC
jgi:hypothetical protein